MEFSLGVAGGRDSQCDSRHMATAPDETSRLITVIRGDARFDLAPRVGPAA